MNWDVIFPIIMIILSLFFVRAKIDAVAKFIKTVSAVLLGLSLAYLIILLTPALQNNAFFRFFNWLFDLLLSFFEYVSEKLLGGGV